MFNRKFFLSPLEKYKQNPCLTETYSRRPFNFSNAGIMIRLVYENIAKYDIQQTYRLAVVATQMKVVSQRSSVFNSG